MGMAQVLDEATNGDPMTIRYRKRIACQPKKHRHHMRAGGLACDCGLMLTPWPYTLLPMTDVQR